MRLFIRLLAAAILLSSCDGSGTRSEPPEWVDEQGSPVSAKVITEAPGSEHCDWDDIMFIYYREQGYVGAGGKALARKGLSFDADAPLPSGAAFTGLSSGERELWTSPKQKGEYIYLVTPEDVERWPATDVGCA